MSDFPFDLCGETLYLLPERAILWPRKATLFIADLHLGKAATFRAFGIPLPEGVSTADLDRLSRVLDRTATARLIILGDLLHSAKGRDSAVLAEFTAWRAARSRLNVDLIVGNHDRRAGKTPPEWNISVQGGLLPLPPFVLNHEPIDPPEGYALSGHLHPQMQLIEAGKHPLKIPCFWFADRCAVLPAFSTFTSGVVIAPAPADRVFLVTEQRIIPARPPA